MTIPTFLLQKLQEIEPDVHFSGFLPKVESSSGNVYFAKLGRPGEKEQYEGESLSLKAMGSNAPGLVPVIFDHGVSDVGNPYFISEYKELSPLNDHAAKVLGRRLATELHTSKGSKGFGFEVPTFCGATRQKMGWSDTWEECVREMMGDLLKNLREQGGYTDLCNKGDRVLQEVVPKLLGQLEIEPSLCHGDLWSGNVGMKSDGQPIIFDPSSYYGHNESDLAIARIFGGFPRSFFSEYHKYRPKSEPVHQYDSRGELYELYHYLNHTVLFGGGYAGSAMRKMNSLL